MTEETWEKRGRFGKARPIVVENPLAKPDGEATVANWLLHVPGAHPLWSHYSLAVVHLRDEPGMTPAKKLYPGVTHELMLLALDPEGLDPDDASTMRILTPQNVVVQFEASGASGGDGAAAEVAGLAV